MSEFDIPHKEVVFNGYIKEVNNTIICRVQNKIKDKLLDEGKPAHCSKGAVVDMMVEFYAKHHKIK